MQTDKVAILFNPSAGKGKALRNKGHLEKLLGKYAIPYDLFVTQSEDDLKTLAREKVERYSTLVGVGGDSTFNIIVHEFIESGSDAAFGMIGLGSSNDITREFDLDTLDKACLALKNRHQRRIDLGCVVENDTVLRHYIGQANVGLGVFVTKHAAEMANRRAKWAKVQAVAGISGILKAFRSQKVPFPLTILSPKGEIHGRFVVATFNNIRYWATGRRLCPEAQPDDGKLDGCLIDGCSVSRFVRIALLAKKGYHTDAEEVEIIRSPWFKVSSDEPFEVQTDGEIVHRSDGSTQFKTIQFKILPQALSIIY